MSKLLINEPSLMVLPSLAAILLGLTMTPGKRYTDSLRWDWQ